MSISVALTHTTVYRYDRPIRLSPQVIRLRPAPHARTAVTAYSLTVSPQPHFLNWVQDPQSNWQARVVFPEPVEHFSIVVDLLARLDVFNPFDFFFDEAAETVPFRYPEVLQAELMPFRQPAPAGAALTAYLKTFEQSGQRTIDFLVDLNRDLQQRISYMIRMEPGVQTPEQTLTMASGSCRDSSWLLVQILRHLGFAARFVSGYLIQLKADQAALDGPSGTDRDFTDLHAWCEVYVPGGGWIGLDPTSGLLAGEGHIPLAATPEPASAAPVSGMSEPCEVDFEHDMQLRRAQETPRVTRPYSEAQWSAIDTLGERVDAAIKRQDMRLTMGGEPTFVGIDSPQAEEWNTAAVGPEKQALAARLALRLRERFAPQGLLTYGQGKWYPGESLPRWAYSLIWRSDNAPIWRDTVPITVQDGGARLSSGQAEALIRGMASRLQLPQDCVLPAFEDPLHFTAEEARLPVGVSAEDADFADPESRARLMRVLSQPLGEARGHVLPVQCWQTRAGPTWVSERWAFRRGQLFLVPGDSPVGLRLPLDSLPGGATGAGTVPVHPRDPLAPASPLPPRFSAQQPHLQGQEQTLPTHTPSVVEGHRAAGIRTALVVEPGAGLLRVFLPPTHDAEEYLTLVATAEDCAAELELPVRIEGYGPPDDPRLRMIKLTPDPGVIEVNVQPASNWPELKSIVEGIYDDARQTRLGTEKFLVDGKHTGTGGGNHIVVGGPTAADSPFLRRPDLLGSMIRCWQNQPSLSYLFAGLFIGPTSQSPRIDEARDDALYEMDIALAQLPDPTANAHVPHWLVDRIFRNLLTDLSGNTHRSEICIDKLFSPDSATGRLGLVELRAFEMPPHARMSLVQQLLVRALLAWFWHTPYTAPLKRWGAALHDRMLLPHFLEQDLADLLAQLRGFGFDFDPAWFAPHAEFRCPTFGSVSVQSQTLTLRGALEPWHTMGEEPGGGGTARYVDSSVERLEVTIDNFQPERFVLTCNGRRVPLQPGAGPGAFVGGVRFRAWQPWSCLHPTIPAHNPLRFDLLDTWSGHAAGGCVYHVHHPGGRAYDSFPINANEAESRRLARFFPFGHSPGPREAPPLEHNPWHRVTLDLRHPPVASLR